LQNSCSYAITLEIGNDRDHSMQASAILKFSVFIDFMQNVVVELSENSTLCQIIYGMKRAQSTIPRQFSQSKMNHPIYSHQL
jgi:hypothetical protein